MHTRPYDGSDRRVWKKWFAWRPVETIDHRLVWLETIEWRWDDFGYDPGWEYRLLGDTSAEQE